MSQHTNLPPDDLSFGEPDEVTASQSETYLASPYPVWLLTPFGRIIAANLLAQWFWEVRELSDLFGFTAFDIFSKNRSRIPKEKNNEFFRKKIPVFKRLSPDNKRLSTLFLEYVENDPILRKIYDEAKYIPDETWESKRVWKYPLLIKPPVGTKSDELLKLQVTVYRLTPNNEFLGVYKPDPSSLITRSLMAQKYQQAMTIADMIEYVQYERREDRGGEGIVQKEGGIQLTEPEATRKVYAALENRTYSWRTLPSISRESEIAPEEVSTIIDNLGERGLIVEANRRNRETKEMVTVYKTKERYEKEEPKLNRFLSALANVIK
ncbi:hypothetical protein KSF_083990 [Reticulibacter mediterranei]|uniref:Uncharacterized protein n=1 Tax=Reticulibacter mediterranei TaxID=2778369 RepID=A0A8J3IPJ1_9CHLR|nr:hypothetical protein [Reticulibacter mediterranei]GHO98351.1 hypothetical protein KSF_083990 [Reticulibacter mediterranei]